MNINDGLGSEQIAEVRVKEKLNRCLFEKYGFPADGLVSDLLGEELDLIKAGGNFHSIDFLDGFVDWLKVEKLPYWLRGAAGSSFALYLLDIIRANPLDRHYFCPECKAITWVWPYQTEATTDGEEIIVCENDGSQLIVDGYGLPVYSLWGLEGQGPTFTIDLPKASHARVKEYLEVYIADKSNSIREELEIDVDGQSIYLGTINFVFTIADINPDFYDQDLDKSHAVRNYQEILALNDELSGDVIRELPAPETFDDLVAYYGLAMATDAWSDKVRFMVEELGYALSQMITYREDIYDYLYYNGHHRKLAWELAERAGKGKEKLELDAELKERPDRWKYAVCQGIKYLFPKAHGLEYIYFRTKNHK